MEPARQSSNAIGGQPMPELGRLKGAAERIAISADRVDSFLERFHGSQPTANSTKVEPSAHQNYRDDLGSLFMQIDRLEIFIVQLDAIG